MKNFIFKYYLYILSFFLVVVLVLVFFLFKSNLFLNNTFDKNEIKVLTNQVGKHMFLPEGEAPTIATVSDPTLLKGQVFFENAKVGDKVLIYANAKKAILYDPIADKIVTIAPLNIDTPKNITPALNTNSLQEQF